MSTGRTAIALASARSMLWPVLRRTRYRLLAAIRDNPLDADVLEPVIDALATAEAALIERDGGLKARRGRGPRPIETPLSGDEALRERIRELEQEVRAREEQIAIVAHDLRTPLSPVSLIVTRLLEEVRGRGADDAVPVRTLVPRFESLSFRLQDFVRRLNHLLDVARLHTQQLALAPEPLDLVAVVHAAVMDVRADAGDRVRISIEGDPEVHGRWDRLRVDQIVRNLVSNAVRFGAMQPVVIDVRQLERSARLAVRDRGMGIAPADHARIFERYTRVSQAGSGLGLGLWIVRELCTAMGGAVSVDSELGRGATFTVTLPLDVGR